MANQERRASPRIEEQSAVLMRVVEAPGAPKLVNETFYGTTDNISAGGMQVHLAGFLPTGTILEVTLILLDPVGVFKHMARVVWVRQLETAYNYCAVGIEITDSVSSSSTGWKETVTRKVSANLADHG